MTYGNPWQSYKQVATTTAPPGHLVLMLYDGAIAFLHKAIAGFESEDPLEFNRTINNNIIRAQDIINELNLSLNMTAGGEFASRLRGLYLYFDRRLQESNVAKESAGIHEVIQRLTVVRDAWAEMLTKNADGTSPQPGANVADTPRISLESLG